jgi:hypothetical protein
LLSSCTKLLSTAGSFSGQCDVGFGISVFEAAKAAPMEELRLVARHRAAGSGRPPQAPFMSRGDAQVRQLAVLDTHLLELVWST